MTRGRFHYFSFSDESRKKSVPGMKTCEIYYVFNVINHLQFLGNMLHIILRVYHPKQAFELYIGLSYIYTLFILYKNTYL